MLALVLFIRNAIAVFVVLGVATEAPGQERRTGNGRSRRITVTDFTLLCFVMHGVVFNTLHFFLGIVANIPQSTDCDICTQGEVDIPRQVETKTRSHEHRVVHRVTTVGTVLDSHFTRIFHKDIKPARRKDIQARTVNKRIGTLVGKHITRMEVPHDRYTQCTEIQGEHQGSGEVHFIRRIGVGITRVVIQVPRMARTNAGTLFTRRDIDIDQCCGGKEAPGIAHKTGLHPDIHVTTAIFPKIAFAATAQVGVIVIKRQGNTQIQEFLQTDSQVDITRQRARLRMEGALLLIHREHAATRLGPGVQRNIATRSNFNAALPQCIGVVLMYTGRSALKPRLSKGKTTSDQ